MLVPDDAVERWAVAKRKGLSCLSVVVMRSICEQANEYESLRRAVGRGMCRCETAGKVVYEGGICGRAGKRSP